MKKLKGIKAVITDADNTIYSWIDYIVPSLEALTETLHRVTGFSREAIVESMKKIFSKYNTNEYAFVLQEAEIFDEIRRNDYRWFQEHVVNPARYSFNRARKMNLHVYPGVHKTLQILCGCGIRVIGLSDAPAFPAEQRLKHLAVDRYIEALYALKSYPVPKGRDLDERIVNRIRLGYYKSHIRRVVELPLSFEKPSTRGLARILEEERLRPERVVLIGDSVKKDIRIAQEMGIADVWARYGTVIAPEMREKLNFYSAPEIQRRNVSQPGDASYAPTWTVDRFDQLLDLIELPPAAPRA
jgi:phosphoglycolate phosphatase